MWVRRSGLEDFFYKPANQRVLANYVVIWLATFSCAEEIADRQSCVDILSCIDVPESFPLTYIIRPENRSELCSEHQG